MAEMKTKTKPKQRESINKRFVFTQEVNHSNGNAITVNICRSYLVLLLVLLLLIFFFIVSCAMGGCSMNLVVIVVFLCSNFGLHVVSI